MAKVLINKIQKRFFKNVTTKNSYAVRVLDSKPGTANFVNIVPFRIRFTSIGIENYGGGSGTPMAAPIGIAIIGYSNYVM
jgi:hypothetical protein